MKRLVIVLGLVLACQLTAYADPEMPVGNDPLGFYDKVYALVEKSDPRAGVYFNAEAGEFSPSVSAKIVTKEVGEYTLDAVLGYGSNKLAYVALETDILAGISHLTGATLSVPWIEVNVGPGVGYSWDSEDFSYGLSLNASKKW